VPGQGSTEIKRISEQLTAQQSRLYVAILTSILTLTCRRLHEILQPELESRITPELAGRLLRWATANSKPHIVAKFHSIHPTPPGGSNWYYHETALHVAAQSGNTEIARLLLEAGGNPKAEYSPDLYQPLHLDVQRRDLEMMKLLLDYGAPIGSWVHGQTALHYACEIGDLRMIELLLQRGADVESGQSRHSTGYRGNGATPRGGEILDHLTEAPMPR
jgi:hypothetical protein